ncbi:hypothetical protein NEF87_003995 [Candidatus Lokiarchaeum ossiferum]|uniref:Uncharacterized protein n=1 Tax=Candidatus Lokiarchaeum ossiferum TaxID=2951803 RepID=A0ABY6HW08_9ARCH|nr:hypothetical protein NEF87_003995 [Candidatus Lokiarchaeum sp. B-35]
MKRKISVPRSRAPLYAVMIIITIIAFIFLVRVIGNNDQFNNSQVNGEYQGTVNLQGQPQIELNITFDGIGELFGSIEINNQTLEFQESTYASFAGQIHFFINFPESEFSLTFNGTVSSNAYLLTGDVLYIDSSENTNEGYFYLSKLN